MCSWQYYSASLNKRMGKLVAVTTRERQMPKTNQPLADDSTGNSSIKKPSLILKVSICMGCL